MIKRIELLASPELFEIEIKLKKLWNDFNFINKQWKIFTWVPVLRMEQTLNKLVHDFYVTGVEEYLWMQLESKIEANHPFYTSLAKKRLEEEYN